MSSHSKTGIFCAVFTAFLAVLAYILHSYGKDEDMVELLLGVCVLSAPAHHEQREAIRATWAAVNVWKDMDVASSRTMVKFVVGTEACQVHPADRVDQYSCNEWTPVILSEMERDFEAFTSGESATIGPPASLLSVRVLHPVVLKRIGILESVMLTDEPLVVSAYQDFEEEEMSSVKFSVKDPGIIHKGYRYQPVEPVVLYKVALAEKNKSHRESVFSNQVANTVFGVSIFIVIYD